MNLIPHLVIWAILATVVIILLIFRSKVSRQEDEGLHVLDSDAARVPQQIAIAKKLENIDRWGKILTIITVVYGLALAGLYVWNVWDASTRVAM